MLIEPESNAVYVSQVHEENLFGSIKNNDNNKKCARLEEFEHLRLHWHITYVKYFWAM